MFSNYAFAVIDFSKNNPFPPPAEFLKSILHATGLNPSRITVVARNNQQAELQAVTAGFAQIKWVDDNSLFMLGLTPPVVKQEVLGILQATPSNQPILVTSYNGAVLGEVQRMGYPTIDVQSLSQFKPGFSHSPTRSMRTSQFVVDATGFTQMAPPPAKPIWRFDGFCGERDGQMLLIRALHASGALDRRHTLSMPNVKPAMGRLDGRFLGSGQTNGTGGMLGALVGGAHCDGLIDVAVSYNGTHYMWLTPRAVELLAAPIPMATLPAETNDPPVKASARSVVTVNGAPSASVNVQCPEVTPAAARQPRDRSPHKSQRMQDALISNGCGPRTKQRLAALDRVGELLGKREGNSLTDILDAARDQLIAELPDDVDKQATIAALNAVRKMLREFLPASGALKDEKGQPIAGGFRAGPAVVADFEPDWRMMTEAQLLLKLIAVFPEPINAEHDAENIVGALYHVRAGQERRALKRQVEAMIGHLLDKCLVREIFTDGHRVLALGGRTAAESDAAAPALRLAQNG